MDSFDFESGKTLEDVKVEYMTFGTPIYDKNGKIKNAILYCHGSLGNFSSMKKVIPLSGDDDAFDKNKYFLLKISAKNISINDKNGKMCYNVY